MDARTITFFDFDWLMELTAGVGMVILRIGQKIGVITYDIFLLVPAALALLADRNARCGEPIRFYGLLTMALTVLDIVLETRRLASESDLDRLTYGEDLLRTGPVEAPLPIRGSTNERTKDLSPLRATAQQERMLAEKRLADLQMWSIVFSLMVGLVFCMFAAQDEDCAAKAPNLYSYIHLFSYAVVLRAGFMMVIVCFRSIKNYDSAAVEAMHYQNQEELCSF